jgi:hypothetical protein
MGQFRLSETVFFPQFGEMLSEPQTVEFVIIDLLELCALGK